MPHLETVEANHTHDEHLRDYFSQPLAEKVLEKTVVVTTQEQRDEPHEYNGFGD